MEQAHGGNLKEAAEKFNISESEIIDFSANINFVGPPPDIYSKIRKEIEAITRYPEPDSTSLKKLLAEKYGGKTDNYVLGNEEQPSLLFNLNLVVFTLTCLVSPFASLCLK